MGAADVWMASHQQRSRAVTWVAQGERGRGEGTGYHHGDLSPRRGPHTQTRGHTRMKRAESILGSTWSRSLRTVWPQAYWVAYLSQRV